MCLFQAGCGFSEVGEGRASRPLMAQLDAVSYSHLEFSCTQGAYVETSCVSVKLCADLEITAMFFSSHPLLYPPNLVLIKLKGELPAPPPPSKVSLHLVTRLPFPYSLCPSSKLVGGDIQPGCPKATGDLKLCPMRRRGEKRHYHAE